MLLVSVTLTIRIVHFLLKQKQTMRSFSRVKVIWPRHKMKVPNAKYFLFHHNSYLVEYPFIRITSFSRFGSESSSFFKTGFLIPFQARVRHSCKSFSFFGCSFFIRRSTSSHRCSMGFMLGEKQGHLSRCIRFWSNQFVTICAVCFESLSCWNHQSLTMFNFFADCNKFFRNIPRYSSPLMFPSINTKLPRPDDEKYPQYLTFSPLCFTVGTVHLGSSSSLVDCQTMTFPSDPNKLNLLPSDQIALFQKLRDFS